MKRTLKENTGQKRRLDGRCCGENVKKGVYLRGDSEDRGERGGTCLTLTPRNATPRPRKKAKKSLGSGR